MSQYKLYVGGNNSGFGFYINVDGKAFGWGKKHTSGVFGFKEMKKNLSEIPMHYFEVFPELTKKQKILKICTGTSHTLIHTDTFEVYTCGSNNYHALGMGENMTTSTYVYTPRKIPFFKDRKVLQIYTGYGHNIFITRDGIYSNGWNNEGQLGIGSNVASHGIPTKMTFKDTSIHRKVKSIKCGGWYSLILDRTGVLYKTGKAWHEKAYLIPTIINNQYEEMKVKEIFTSVHHYFVMRFDYKIYGVGDNDYKKMTNEINGNVKHPKLIPALKGAMIKDIIGGSENVLILYRNGNVYGLGRKSDFSAQEKHKSKLPFTNVISYLIGTNITQIDASYDNSYMIDVTGQLYIGGPLVHSFNLLNERKNGSMSLFKGINDFGINFLENLYDKFKKKMLEKVTSSLCFIDVKVNLK